MDWQKEFTLGVFGIALFSLVQLLLKLPGLRHPLSTHSILVVRQLVRGKEVSTFTIQLGKHGTFVWVGRVLLLISAFLPQCGRIAVVILLVSLA